MVVGWTYLVLEETKCALNTEPDRQWAPHGQLMNGCWLNKVVELNTPSLYVRKDQNKT